MSELERQQAELFRRRRFEAPHRRRHPLRRLARPFASSVVVVGLPAALVWWVLTTSELEVGEIDVVSTGRVSGDWIAERLEPLRGRQLLTLSLSEIESCVAGHPWISSVAVRRELPGRLEVRVREKRPAALWRVGSELWFLDSAGRLIAPLDAEAGDVDLPLVSGSAEPEPAIVERALEVAAAWERLRADDRVSEVELLPQGDFRLITTSLPFAVVVSAERMETAPAALARALPLIDRRFNSQGRVAVVDLRFSRQVVFQPAALPPREEG